MKYGYSCGNPNTSDLQLDLYIRSNIDAEVRDQSA